MDSGNLNGSGETVPSRQLRASTGDSTSLIEAEASLSPVRESQEEKETEVEEVKREDSDGEDEHL